MAPGPVVRRLDDPEMPWQRVKAQLNADGTESSVWEKWFAFRADPPYLSLYARYDPGMVVRRHGHRSPHVVFVLDGEILVGDELCATGTHIELPQGEQFGPLVAGDTGCTLFEVMLGDPRSWSDDPSPFEEACGARGVTPLPDPEIDFPDWLADQRSLWIDSPEDQRSLEIDSPEDQRSLEIDSPEDQRSPEIDSPEDQRIPEIDSAEADGEP